MSAARPQPVPQSVPVPPTRSVPGASNHPTPAQAAALAAGNWPLLARLCKQALRKNPRDLPATRLLAHALAGLGKTAEALAMYRSAELVWPDDGELLINHANTLLAQARNDEALPLLEKVCALRPEKAQCWLKLAQCCYLLTRHETGFAAALKAAALAQERTEQAAALTQKAIHRRELGQIQQAVRDCEAAIALTPTDPANHTNRLLFMLADPDCSAARLTQAARAFAAVFEPALRPHWPDFAAQRGAPWRRLRVGFLSPDFRVHSVMYFVEGLLAQLDRRQFEVHALHLFPRADHVTQRVRRHADRFVNLSSLGAQQQAQAIRALEIDILIDLAGHTGYNGLLALAHKAAPVQVAWLGFPATTGLQAVDYRLTDDITDAPDAQAEYSERLYRLPTLFACYRPLSRQPLWRYQPRYQVRPTPALANGCVTFGSCNNLGKIGDPVLALWGRVLAAVPGARLLIEGKNLGQREFAGAYAQRCARLGIAPDRLDLVALDGDNQFLTYHRVDIALDPFPLTGGTTSFDALWMGVPLVSMAGQSFKSRMGLGLLTHLGRSAWIARTPDDYVRIARELAADSAALNRLRLGLRAQMEGSALMREDLFNRHFGAALRNIWHDWLARCAHPDDAAQQQARLAHWRAQCPPDWELPPAPGVAIAPGRRISLADAHQRLQRLAAKARAAPAVAQETNAVAGAGAGLQIRHRRWVALTRFAQIVLDAVPQDPLALCCLAEVERAHGHGAFALTYLQHALQAMRQAQADRV